MPRFIEEHSLYGRMQQIIEIRWLIPYPLKMWANYWTLFYSFGSSQFRFSSQANSPPRQSKTNLSFPSLIRGTRAIKFQLTDLEIVESWELKSSSPISVRPCADPGHESIALRFEMDLRRFRRKDKALEPRLVKHPRQGDGGKNYLVWDWSLIKISLLSKYVPVGFEKGIIEESAKGKCVGFEPRVSRDRK